MDKDKFTVGMRVQLTEAIPDLTTDVHPVHLWAGDLGTVQATNRNIGVAFDRYHGDIITVHRKLDDKTIHILDLCVQVNDDG